MKATALMLLAGCALALAGCSEKPQTITASHKKSDAQSWQGAANDPFVVKGWTAGDQTSWHNQIRERNQYQNEYKRVQ
jgi:starvation-inducible outer membrane lipoprotein